MAGVFPAVRILDRFIDRSAFGLTGKAGARLKDEDSLEDVVYVNDHDRLLFFTSEGRVHALHAYEVPEAARTAVGTAITQVNACIAAWRSLINFGPVHINHSPPSYVADYAH
jgi:DNA gyrase/topoisomerase IV subunit A